MNPYESGAVIDMNMGHNSATPASIGAQPPSIGGRTLRMVLQDMRHPAYPPYVSQFADAIENALASAAQRDLLRDFARAVMQAWPEGGIDGGELQDIALAHGLLRPAEPPTDWDGCNFYEPTELIK